jgi:hypothetical protein
MMDLIERVARAIAAEIGDLYEAGPDTYDALARAAIRAIRDDARRIANTGALMAEVEKAIRRTGEE